MLAAHQMTPATMLIMGCVLMIDLLGFKQCCVLLAVLRLTPAYY